MVCQYPNYFSTCIKRDLGITGNAILLEYLSQLEMQDSLTPLCRYKISANSFHLVLMVWYEIHIRQLNAETTNSNEIYGIQ